MAETETRRLPAGMATRAILAEPATLNVEAREVDVTFSTGGRARQWIDPVGMAWEELDMSPNAVRMGTLTGGNAPVLDAHCRYEASDVLGRVTAARLEGGVGVATLRFSMADDVAPIWQRISEGTLRCVSIGYRVFRYELIREADGTDVYRAVDWEPIEISVVPIPADAGATVRAEGGTPPVITDLTSTRAGAAARNPEASILEPTTPPGAQVAPPVPPNLDAIRAEAITAERARLTNLRAAARDGEALLPADRVRSMLEAAETNGEATEATLRAQIFDATVQAARAAQTQPATGTPGVGVGVSHDAPDAIRAAMTDAVVAQILPGIFKPANDQWRAYAGWAPSAMATELLRLRGERDIPRDRSGLAERSFAPHSTSDFPLLLANALNKALLVNYELAPPTFKKVMARRTFNDFRAHNFLRVGDFPTLLAVGEDGEIKSGTISENKEVVTLATYARKVQVTRQVIINDTLGAFADFAGMIGRRIADFENATAFAVLNTASGAGPTLLEGSAAVFTTGRTNKAASGGAIDATTVSAGRAVMRGMTSIDGLKLNLSPSILLTGAAYETAAEQLVHTVQPTQISQVNPFAGKLTNAADANIPGNRWYLFADPAVAPVYVYGYLAGAEGPQTKIEAKFAAGVEISVLLDLAVGAVDYRGGYFNAGA